MTKFPIVVHDKELTFDHKMLATAAHGRADELFPIQSVQQNFAGVTVHGDYSISRSSDLTLPISRDHGEDDNRKIVRVERQKS